MSRLSDFVRLMLLLAALCGATLLAGPARADEDFLPPEQAFKFSAHMENGHTLVVDYAIAEGYHMYRERFKFAASGATLGEPVIPPGKVEFDDTFNKNVETYHHGVQIRIPVQGQGPFTLTSTGQGCADKGLCYPPQDSTAQLAAGGASGAAPAMSLPPGQSATPQFSLPGQGAPQVDTPPAPSAAASAAAAPAAAPSDLSGIAGTDI